MGQDYGAVQLTTIAYRDGVLAADTLASSIPGLDRVTKLKRRGDAIYGVSGSLLDCQALVDWYFGPRDAPPKYFLVGDERPDAALLVMHDDGRVYASGWGGYATELTNSYAAIGSGSEYAVGAMYMGANAIRAIQAAMRHDNNTGGEIDYAGEAGHVARYSDD